MKKPKRIAVIFKGLVRTWHHISPYVFSWFEKNAEHVDYYFITWDIPNLDLEKLTKSFHGRNLIKGIKIPPKQEVYNHYIGPWYFQKKISPFVEQQNAVTPYDAVINTRFDIMPFGPEEEGIPVPPERNLYCCWHNDNNHPNGSMSDVYLLSDMHSFLIQNNLFEIQMDRLAKVKQEELNGPSEYLNWLRQQTGDTHNYLWKFFVENGVKLNTTLKRWVIIRPQILHYYENLGDIVKTHNFKNTNQFRQQWDKIKLQRRVYYCKKFDLNLYDFGLEKYIDRPYKLSTMDPFIAEDFRNNFRPVINAFYVPEADRSPDAKLST